MSESRLNRLINWYLLVFLFAFIAMAPAGPTLAADAPAAPAPVPEEVRTGIEAALQGKVNSLIDLKNEEGLSYVRGSYSHNFKKVDDATYEVAFHKDTAAKDKLIVERYQLTLKKNPTTGKWTIASEELKDTYSNLYRAVTGDEDAARFERFNFDREGLKLTASNGTLFKAYRQGKVQGFAFAAKDIHYEYLPPEPKDAALYQELKKDHASDVLFDPEYVNIRCDPTTCDELLSSAFTGLSPIKTEEAGPLMNSKREEYVKNAKKNRKDNFFSDFRIPDEPDHRRYDVVIAKDSPDRRVGLDYDTWEPREVSYWAYSLDKRFPRFQKVYHYDSAATKKSGANPYDLELRDDIDARDYDLTGLKGTVELALEDSETLNADLTYVLKTKRSLREIPFLISRLRQDENEKKEAKDPQLSINSVQDGSGRELTFVKLGASSGIVVLPDKVPAGTVVTLRMQFENKAGIYAISPTFSYVDRDGWMPFVRFTDMINDFDLTVKVPSKYKALGIGKKVSESIEGDVQVTRWVAESPVEFPSIIFGDYVERTSSIKVVKANGEVVPVIIHVDKLGKMEGAEKSLENLADQAANSLNLYSQIYGVDYPYGKLDLVNDPVGLPFYGQSPSSLIYLGNFVFLGSNKAGALFESGDISKFNREVVPHEVGHQWWGSLIPNHNTGNYWFVESLAEYSSALYLEAAESDPVERRKAYQEKVAAWRRTLLDSDLQCSVQDAPELWSGSGNNYIPAVYNKGPYAFHVMRMTWGDEKFFKFLKDLAQSLKNRDIVTRDIQKVAERDFGGNMDFFFDQWLRGVGIPEYTFTYGVRQTEDGKYQVQGTIAQRILVGQKKDPIENLYYTAIVPITLIGKDGKEYRYPLKVQGPSIPFLLKTAEKPKEITLNKYGESLAYDVIVKRTD